MEVPVYYFFRGDFPGVEFFALELYIHVLEMGPEVFLLVIYKRLRVRGLSCNRILLIESIDWHVW